MSNTKITWNDIFNDFKLKHPEMAENVVKFRPFAYHEILIFYEDGKKFTYSYDTKKYETIE